MKLILGNCIEKMREIPKGVIDVVFADPPFNLGKKYSDYSDNKSEEEYLDFHREWMSEVYRILNPRGSFFYHNFPYWLIKVSNVAFEIGFQLNSWIAWDAYSGPYGKPLLKTHFGILHLVKQKTFKSFRVRKPHDRCRKCNILIKNYGGKKCHEFGPVVSNVWTDIHRIKHKKRRDNHPCQLSRVLLERILLMSTEEGDRVLDPFLGTGTTLVAAKRLNRKGIGIDISKVYLEIARVHLKKEIFKSQIGGYWVSYDFNGKVRTIRDDDWEGLKDFIGPSKKLKLWA